MVSIRKIGIGNISLNGLSDVNVSQLIDSCVLQWNNSEQTWECNVLELVPTDHSSTTSTYGISTATKYGHAKASSSIPASPTQTGAVGTTTSIFALSDHAHPEQQNISGNASTATSLQTSVNIDGISFNGTSSIIHYGICDTGAAVAAKSMTITGFQLQTGSKLFVKFTSDNTAENVTLNVNNTGDIAVYYNNSQISGSDILFSGYVYEFIYDGEKYIACQPPGESSSGGSGWGY